MATEEIKKLSKVKKTKLITYFYTRKYLIRHLVSELGLKEEDIKEKSTKWLRDLLYKTRNAIEVTPQ